MSDPVGAFFEEHEALPELRVAVHMALDPIVNLTVPVGATDEDDTVAL